MIRLLLLLSVLFTSVLASAAPPNILFIYTDDQSSRTVSCYPEAFDWVETPNIDALAAEGVRFSHAYIGSWCMPSRATMLTGHHQHGIESMRMEGTYPGSAYDPEKCPFLPSVFRQQGYTTAHFGKWHTGVDAGFGRDWDVQKVWNRPAHPQNAPNYYDNQLISTNGGEPIMTKGYTTDNYTDWTIDFIEDKAQHANKPWYVWLCYGAVHGPFTPADRHKGSYDGGVVPAPSQVYGPRPGKPAYVQDTHFWEPGQDGQPAERKVRENSPVGMKDNPNRPLRESVWQYHEGVRAIDENVGRLMAALRASGQLDNTLIIFTSDQGFAWGHHGFKTKVAPYRGNVAAPFIIRPVGGLADGGWAVDAPVSGVDIPPTLCAQAGLELPWAMHGKDLSPLLSSASATWPYPAMLVHTAKAYGSATDEVPPPGDPRLIHGPGIPWFVMLAQDRYKYIRNLVPGEVEELYDIVTDPDESINLALDPANAATVKRFRESTIAELERTEAGFAKRLPPVSSLTAGQ